eukprot:m.5943 g.5943  ORF g.5943 m.5943 type:complete len:260 (-) comp2566_c0_seq1:168-947(-)
MADDDERDLGDWLGTFIPVAILLILLCLWFNCKHAKFDAVACCYDVCVAREERRKVRKWREFLLSRCRGDVLDLAAGTGPNIPFYPATVSSVTLVDKAPRMLAIAHRNLDDRPDVAHTQTVVANIEKLEAFDDASFDTVLSIDCLCSVHNPAAAVAEAVRVLRPGGQLLMADHGRTDSAMRNCCLSCVTCVAYPALGVSYIRDVDQLARGSGLEVLEHVSADDSTFDIYVLQKPGSPSSLQDNTLSAQLPPSAPQVIQL